MESTAWRVYNPCTRVLTWVAVSGAQVVKAQQAAVAWVNVNDQQAGTEPSTASDAGIKPCEVHGPSFATHMGC